MHWLLKMGLAFFFCPIMAYSFNNSQTTQQLDSLFKWCEENLMVDSIRMEVRANSFKALALAAQDGNQEKLAAIHELLSDWHFYYDEFEADSIIYHEEKAKELYQSLGDMEKVADSYGALSIIYLNLDDYEKAEEAIFKAVTIQKEREDQIGLGKSYRRIGVLYNNMEEPEKALEYLLQAVEILGDSDEYYSYCLALMGLIEVYNQKKDFSAAIKNGNKGLSVLEEQQMDQPGILARTLVYRGDAYKGLEQFELAEKDYLAAWKVAVDLVGEERARPWELDVGIIKALKGNYEKALPHLERAVGAIEFDNTGQIWIPYTHLMNCYKHLGDFENAFLYSEKIRVERDSFYASKVENLEAETLIKYEAGKKDEALAYKDEQIKQKNRIQILSFSVAGLLGLMLLGLFFNFRKNKKQSQQLRVLNDDLSNSNKEKEVLLKEIHHRVKNNLQLISSLLSLQSVNIQDKAVKSAILDSQSRVKSMSLIHQKLYRGANLAAVKMKNYFATLTDNLIDAYSIDFDQVQINLDMQDIELDVDHAIPIGLITNELVTNSLKYAFPSNREGEINVTFKKEENGFLLEIADNGEGQSHKIGSPTEEKGFGSQLVEMLTQQLKGQIKQSGEKGFYTQIKFPHLKSVA